MATLTIIKDDNNIAEGGVWRTVDCSSLAANVHAVQWDGSAGWVEYNDGTANETIDSISAYDDLRTAWTNAAPVEQSEAEWLAAQTYDVAREAKYGDIGDQLDMQYKDAVNGTTTWKDHVTKVKSDFPKP
jgi:hypothetical protein